MACYVTPIILVLRVSYSTRDLYCLSLTEQEPLTVLLYRRTGSEQEPLSSPSDAGIAAAHASKGKRSNKMSYWIVRLRHDWRHKAKRRYFVLLIEKANQS